MQNFPNRIRLWLTAGMLLGAGVKPTARAEPSWQAWMDQSVSARLGGAATARAMQSFRYDLTGDQLSTYYLEAGITRRLRPWLDGGAGFRQQYDRRDGDWLEENRPFCEFTPRWRREHFTLSLRARAEYRSKEAQEDVWRFRNKAEMQWDMNEARSIRPYMSVEAFVEESARLSERDRTRCTVGLRSDAGGRISRRGTAAATDPFSVDGYLMRQDTKKDGEWNDEYIVGLHVKLTL